MNKDEVLFRKRMQDLAKASYSRGIPVFTDFLNMNELSVLASMERELAGVRFETSGGYAFAERQMARFVPDALFYEETDADAYPYPITILKIEPLHKKFAEPLGHRDYLGSMLGLGVERGRLGDILVSEDCAYVCCSSSFSGFFCQELTKVRHTMVQVTETTADHLPSVTFTEIRGTVASLRCDAIVAMLCHYSRSQTLALFKSQKLFVNGKLTESGSHLLKEGDVVSVRGYGKFIFEKVLSMTKKDRYSIIIKQFGRRDEKHV